MPTPRPKRCILTDGNRQAYHITKQALGYMGEGESMPRPGRRDQVVEAAVMLFSRKGYHGTTVRDIAIASGMLSGSLYAHVTSKEDLLYEIVSTAAQQFLAALAPIVAGEGSATMKLRAAMVAHVNVVAGSQMGATVFLHEWKALSEPRLSEISAQRQAYESLLGEIIRQGMASGEFRVLDEKFARLLVLSAVNWLYEWYNRDGPLGPDAVADKYADLLLQGFMREGGQQL
jgi:AcrR family transcriptional regulator